MPIRNVLILEDEAFIAMDLQFAFEDEGIKALTATNCEEAFELMARETFDAAVLDVNLGRGKTCEAVARHLNDNDIPFVLHTGDLDRAGEPLRELNAPVIPKPTVVSHVVKRVLDFGEAEAS